MQREFVVVSVGVRRHAHRAPAELRASTRPERAGTYLSNSCRTRLMTSLYSCLRTTHMRACEAGRAGSAVAAEAGSGSPTHLDGNRLAVRAKSRKSFSACERSTKCFSESPAIALPASVLGTRPPLVFFLFFPARENMLHDRRAGVVRGFRLPRLLKCRWTTSR